MSNPLIKNLHVHVQNEFATISGIAMKEIFLVILVIASALCTISLNCATLTTTVVSGIIGLIMVLILSYHPNTAKYLAPLYAIVEGAFLANFSLILEVAYPGIVIQAVILTFCAALVTAFLYAKRIIIADDLFKKVVMILLFSLLAYYAIEIIASVVFGFQFITLNTGIIGLLVDVGILILALMCLLFDYNEIDAAVYNNQDKSTEWYYAFSLLITLIWLYVRVLDLLHADD